MAWPNVYGIDITQFDQSGASRPSKPTVLLVHDAFHSSGHLELLAAELRSADFRVLTPTLPSASANLIPNSLDVDIRTIMECGKVEIDQGRNIVMVAHGYGSVPGCVAADRLDQYSMDRPRAGQIKKLLIIAGIILMPNQSYSDVLNPAWAVSRGGLLTVPQPHVVFFQDMSPELVAWAVSLVRSQNEDSLRTRVRSPGWNGLPVLYVRCENDNSVPSSLQNAFVGLLRQYNRQVAVVSLRSGHCPFLSVVRDVTQLVIRASS